MMPDDNDLIIPGDHRPTRADALKNRRLLLETAGRLFAEYGVDSISMTQVAQEAGVGKGTLYRHFNNKTELCQALLDQEQRDLQERTLARGRTYYAAPCDNLRWFLEEVARFVVLNEELLYAAAETGAIPSMEFQAHLWWRQTIRGWLGRLNPPGDLDYMADVLYVMLDVKTIHFQRHRLGYDLARITSGLHSTLERLTMCC